jgi:hypothetical protein
VFCPDSAIVSSNASQLSLLPRNDEGNDFITSDPHGYIDSLAKQVELLGEADRLFICGDLVDRGPDSLKLVKLILQAQKAGKKIHCVRGNHEDMLLDVLKFSRFTHAMIDLLATDNIEKNYPIIKTCFPGLFDNASNHFGVLFVLSSFQREWKTLLSAYEYGVSPNTVLDDFRYQMSTVNSQTMNWEKQEIERYKIYWNSCCQIVVNGGKWLFSVSEEDCELLKTFIEGLPYVIRVDGEFDVVHAAPLSEEELAVVKGGVPFTEQQILYMTWARPPGMPNSNPMMDKGRSKYSLPVYIGHNSLRAADAINFECNLINLDAGTHFTGCTFFVNHTLGMLIRCGEILDTKYSEEYDEAFYALNVLMQREKLVSLGSPTSVAVEKSLPADMVFTGVIINVKPASTVQAIASHYCQQQRGSTLFQHLSLIKSAARPGQQGIDIFVSNI